VSPAAAHRVCCSTSEARSWPKSSVEAYLRLERPSLPADLLHEQSFSERVQVDVKLVAISDELNRPLRHIQ
jgi:hypothetical protein